MFLAMLGGFAELCIPFDAHVALMPLVNLSGFTGILIAAASSIYLWKMQASGTTFRTVAMSITTLLFLVGQAIPAVK